ncbi:MAG: recombination mediator RecR [Solirubrobacterales bacterium]
MQKLVTELSRLPGIGQRTAQRLAFHILRTPTEEALELAEAIREVKERIGLCEICFNLADSPRCRICEDPRRDHSLICVVEEPGDVIPMERTHEFHGVYHVLGGALSPIDGIDPEDLKVAELYARVLAPVSSPSFAVAAARESGAHDAAPPHAPSTQASPQGAAAELDPHHAALRGAPSGAEPSGWVGSVKEVVLATNPTTTGEATALHIAAGLRERLPELRVTRLASGLPVGADLEYADEVTLGKALAGRRTL